MSESSFPPSEEALSQLICQSHATIRKTAAPTTGVLDRVREFGRLYSDLAIKPEGVALIYRESRTAAVHSWQIGPRIVIGRMAKAKNNPDGCDLAFDDDMMSRRHFEVVHTDGIYLLRDLESRNGTYVNGNPARIREVALKVGDVISAGRCAFFFTGE